MSKEDIQMTNSDIFPDISDQNPEKEHKKETAADDTVWRDVYLHTA